MYSALYNTFVSRDLRTYIHDVHTYIYSVTCSANNCYENQLINRSPIISITNSYKCAFDCIPMSSTISVEFHYRNISV